PRYRADARGAAGPRACGDQVPRWLRGERLRGGGDARGEPAALGRQGDERRRLLPAGRRAELLLPPHARVRDPPAHRSSARQARLSRRAVAARAVTGGRGAQRTFSEPSMLRNAVVLASTVDFAPTSLK